jgi:hypothetical protein
MEVLYLPRIWQWFSILHSQADASRATDLSYLEGAIPTGGELVGTILGKHSPEH